MPYRIIQEIEDVLKAGYLLADDNEMLNFSLAAAAAPPSDRTHATAAIGCLYLQGPHIYISTGSTYLHICISTLLQGSHICSQYLTFYISTGFKYLNI